MAITERALTLDQFLALPESEPPLEYDDGEVTQKVSPKLRHAVLQARLLTVLQATVAAMAYVLPELRVTFAGRSVVPDISLLRRERVPVDDEGRIVDDVLVAPNVAVEILSPGQSTTRVIRRCLWYVENGVEAALLVDPDDESVVVFRPAAQPQVAQGEASIALPEVAPDFAMTAEAIFSALRVG